MFPSNHSEKPVIFFSSPVGSTQMGKHLLRFVLRDKVSLHLLRVTEIPLQCTYIVYNISLSFVEREKSEIIS